MTVAQINPVHGDGFSIIKAFMRFSELGAEWVMYLLMFLGAIMIGLFVQRLIFFRKRRVDVGSLGASLIEALKADDLDKARQLVATGDSMEARVISDALEDFEAGPAVVEQKIESALAAQKQEYDRYLNFFGTLGNNAPFVGLFGTVIGIIVSFQALGNNPKGGLEVVGPGIAEALVATAVGLLIAIPAVVIFNSFKVRVKNHVSNTVSLSGIVKAWAERRAGAS
ncbi:MAG: MotA/TolQ/ExbB proton channel family protein [Bradymonadia bacterium]